ncbi:MAG: NAD(P)/FAD-dependent oxidoreductase [Kiloniellales bacterium]
MSERLFAPDFKVTPYWWERTPRPDLGQQALPQRADVAIVGSGYTGLCAALQTARAGRHTVVLDAEDAGWGCSSRNGGQISTSIKPSLAALAKTHGRDRALAILQEGHAALVWIGTFIAEEGIDCDFRRVGRFYGAHSPARCRALERRIADEPSELPTGAYLVPRAEQHRQIGSDFYHGGIVYPRHASLDPARYHKGLLDRALAAGVQVVPRCAVRQTDPDGTGHRLRTDKGELLARDVVIATSGYSGRLSPWHRRRIIPIGSYIIATEPLAPDLARRLIPDDRVITDTRKLVVYYRLSPDGTRLLFGARVSLRETDPRTSAAPLHAEMTRRFPELAKTRITHSWMGFVGYTFDQLPHLGRRDGIHYAMGYCGSGVSLASYLGTRIGQQLLGLPEGRTALDQASFQSRPYYWGYPWFLAPSIAYYRWRDQRSW